MDQRFVNGKNDDEKTRVELIVELDALRDHNSRLREVVKRYKMVSDKNGMYSSLHGLETLKDNIESLHYELQGKQQEVDQPGEELIVHSEEPGMQPGEVNDRSEDAVRTNEELQSSEQFLNNMFDSIQDGISVLDKDLNIIRINHVMEEWYSDAVPLRGKKCFAAYHGRSAPCEVCPSQRAIKEKAPQSNIVPFYDGHGGIRGWLEVFAFPFKDGNGDVIGVIEHVRDITERRRVEKEMMEAKLQSELYLDLMSHDINNMHQIALGYLELAREMYPEAGKSEYFDKSIEVLRRSARLINNVRKLQKLKEGVFQTRDIDIPKVLADVQREFGAVPHKTLTLNLNGCSHCHVLANELLHDVFSNMVINAIKHTGDQVDITIDMDTVKDHDRNFCRIRVEDNGPGIPDDLKIKIFNRRVKGSGNAKGMGLGLYLVKSLVESYNGQVWVEDLMPGDHTKGARFVVMLPATRIERL